MKLEVYRKRERMPTNMSRRERFKEVSEDEEAYWMKKLKEDPYNKRVTLGRKSNRTGLRRINWTQYY